jgi:TrmH family RNA methyltransferase
MGTTIRTAEAAGVDAVIVTKGSVDPYNSKTLRAAMGAIYHMPIIQVDSDDEWLGLIKERGIKILAGGFEESQDYRSVAYDGSIAIIIGNEANGVDSTLLKAADIIVKIPILGKIESLNASVAAGIIIYKAVEARYFLKA